MMQITKIIRLGAALAAASLPVLSLAQNQTCEGPLVVSAQEHLDIIGRDCTTIVGDLRFNETYTGPFVLRNVQNITGSLMAVLWEQESIANRQVQVTQVSLPDLKYINKLDFMFSAALVNVSAPKLEMAKGVWMTQVPEESEAHFPVLRDVDYLVFNGNYSRIEVPGLRNVTGFLEIEHGNNTNNHPLNVSLASLEYVNRFVASGKTSPASLSFPALSSVGEKLEVDGAIARIDMPSLRNTESKITIKSTTPLNISLPLESWPQFLGFFGAIEQLSLPNIEGFVRVRIESNLPLDCAALDRFFEPIVANITDVKWETQNIYHCSSTAVDGSGAVQLRMATAVITAPLVLLAGFLLG
ncbi:uncharacterized protein BDW70DRAFT_128555 [Aspergillus foveolatus]|uniref:uncharacterized protein n=1 Tax=Aspergillus foveolatus TaxID=210207 RepID=UPI003CCE4E3A